MRQSHLFTKTRKEAPKDETAKNAKLLIRAGFVHKEMAGVYAYLPLGLRVIEKVKTIIREEMNAVGGQELELTALQQKDVWEKTDRWSDELDDGIWFKTALNGGSDLGLAFTHEEPLTSLMGENVNSYKDLPAYVYQFQTKFRNELRAKSGILRGREFLMKDLYDFSLNKEDHEAFYEKMKEVYMRVFTRAGIGDKTYLTISSGGSFSKYSYEFQTLTEAGEDVIVFDEEKKIAINKDDYSKDLLSDFGLTESEYSFKEAKAVEVGDIYSLGEKFSRALGLTYKDADGNEQYVYMGSYGIGVPRLVGTIVEVFGEENAMLWPKEVAPFDLHLIQLGDDEGSRTEAEALYQKLIEAGVEVLWDDRATSAGDKFADADLIGIPLRVVVSTKAREAGGVEFTDRLDDTVAVVSPDEVLGRCVSSE
ncbi:MAG: aminoacyl--tRNA ligase-related protein [Candidatus Paceibacterota bacterium]